MSFYKSVVSSKTAFGVCLALGTLGSLQAATDNLTLATSQPQSVNQIGTLSESKKPTIAVSKKSTYIVRLHAPAVAAYDGGIGGMAATSLKSTGLKQLKTESPSVKTYSTFLKQQQKSVSRSIESTIGRNISMKYQYSHVFNGMAIELTEQEAQSIAKLPSVKSIEKERIEYPTTDAGPAWIGAKNFWNLNSRGLKGNMGEGIVVAVLDTGINHDHASFADIGGDGYDHTNPLGSGNYVPGSYCDVVDPTFCNDKLIGAWNMVNSSLDPNSPEDSDGHGSHTASTTAGNIVKSATISAPTTDLVRETSGVAPHANIIAYDVCIDTCPGSALLAAVEQVVIDAAALPNGIQALNYSISGGDDPYNDSVELGFLNATAAGIFVSASAGNDGPGASTSAHSSPWVATVAALTHNRTIDNSLVDLTSDGASLSSLSGKGFTSPYGPAKIVYAGDFPTANGSSNDTDPAQCLEPFPAGHFNGEIVICDRGSIARVDKGANVLAGGAGGLVLANAEANGESTSADGHFLPAVHLGFTDGERLKDWVASNQNTEGSITGATPLLDDSLGDVTAGFSSRGPATKVDVIKPDIGGPGVDIIAAVNSTATSSGDEFGFLSGTSMSSPHNAGSGALVAGSTDWTPYEIKSALMMTAKDKRIFKEDGVTAADPFDTGAGRIDLNRVLKSGLVLNETPENFLAADPALGGDPKTLNIASMQDSSCVEGCSWTRTVTNRSGRFGAWTLFGNPNTKGMNIYAEPFILILGDGESAEVKVTVDTAFAQEDWAFGDLELLPLFGNLANLHMPIAAYAGKSSSPFLESTVDKDVVKRGEEQTYTIDLANGALEDQIDLSTSLPKGLEYVEGSATQTVTNGSTVADFAFDGDKFTWSGSLDTSGVELEASGDSPAGYLPLSLLGVQPATCPSNCDDGAVIFNVAPFTVGGTEYSQVIFSMNGALELGTDSGLAVSATNSRLPSESAPNNLLAPLWTDLDMGAGGNFYAGTLSDGVNDFNVFEWENAPRFGTDPSNPANTHSFQIWIQADDSENIWFTYGPQGDLTGVNATVGIEGATGATGDTVYFNGEGTLPVAGSELKASTLQGGSASFTFKAKVKKCKFLSGYVSRTDIESAGATDSAIATSTCTLR
ncbi:S8 family serine peptidase [Alteromonas sp. a30]|uniref:S8 family serine peptidase n=1 Tax=Alteromonas sp. a30 TaxID=2730917 RepID=UPI00227FEFBB|nr:S8 family serine peptidase [Alteromonas sp. a30]MCY7297312.1 S8 family serine peptidase [Alteromonas sp. a30]